MARHLSVGATPWAPTTESQIQEVRLGWHPTWDSQWWIAFDDTGAETLHLYPTPGVAGTEIRLEYVYRPTDLANTGDEPDWLPEEFHKYLLHYAASEAFITKEDNPDLGQFHSDKFDQAVIDLKRYRVKRSTPGPFRIRVVS